MSDYNAYGELYDKRPELVIHDRLKHCGSVKELINIAKEKNFKVGFESGPLRHDLLIRWHEEDNRKPESYSLSSGLRYIKRLDNI